MSQPINPIAGMRRDFESAARVHRDAAARAPIDIPAAKSVSLPIAAKPDASPVTRAIASAARQTGVDFDFLIAQAQVESAMDPKAKARTSSATGLYQFIESTWLGTMKRHGGRFGLGDIAAQISKSASGAAIVPDPAQRAAILNMRNDPQIASLMAAGLAEDNRAHLVPTLGREPDNSELYLAHFLGAGGASRFLSAMQQNPAQSAASLFPRPAAANRPVFFEPSGSPRSLGGVMTFLSAKLERALAMTPSAPTPSALVPSAKVPSALVPSATGAGQTPLPAQYAQAAPAPYLIADESVFAPGNPPAISAPSMSAMLSATFGEGSSSASSRPDASRNIQRAYTQLKAFGL